MDVGLWLSTCPTSTFAGAGEDYPSSIDADRRLHSELSLQTLPSIPSLQNLSLETPPFLLSATSLHLTTLPADIGAIAVHCNLLYAAYGHQINVYDVNANFNLIDKFNNTTHDYSSSGSVKSITFLKDRVFTAHQDGKICSWKFTNEGKHKLIAVLPTVKDRLCRSIFPSNYAKIRRHKKRLWIEHYDAVSGLCFSNQGYLVSVSWDRSLKIWRETDYRCIQSIKAHDDAINAVIVSSDGVIYTASADRRIKVWAPAASGDQNQRSYSMLANLEKHRSAVNALALSGDESVLFSGACDRSILVWEKDGGANYMSVSGALRGHSGAVLCLVSVSDLLISGSGDRTVRVWRRGYDGKYCCLSVLDGHEKAVRSLAATAECGDGGLKVISGSSGGVINAWQIVFSTCH